MNGLVALLLGFTTAATHGVFGVLLLTSPGYLYIHFDIVYVVPLNIQAVTTAVQATAFLSIRQQTGNEKLFVATAIALVAAGSISWLTIVGPVLSVSNVFVAICFLKIQMTP
jgi:hypothetical protein